MVFSSIVFLFAFLPTVLFFYFALALNRAAKNYVLLIFSLLFYAWGGFNLSLYGVVPFKCSRKIPKNLLN